MKNIRSIYVLFILFFFVTNAFSQLEVTFSGDTTKIWDNNISWYCDAKFTMIVNRVGDSITVVERDTSPMVRCKCNFTLCASVLGLPSGNYTAYVSRQLIYSFLGENVDTTITIGTIAFNVNKSSTGDMVVKSYQSECSQSPVNVDQKTDISMLPYLLTNYPNPFNPTTTINYQLPENSFTTLKVHDVLGREVGILVNELKSAGTYSVQWNASQFASGVYFVTMRTGSFTATKKLLLMK